MSRPVGPLGDLGNRVSSTLALAQIERASQREVVRSEVVAKATRASVPVSHSSARWVWAAALFVSIVLVSGWGWRAMERPLAFTVDGALGQCQAWLAASEGREMPIRFADGSLFQVRPRSRVRVADASARGARIAIERGELHAEVVPSPQGAWWIIAGPFSVHVTGTVFDVRWDPATERFSVSVFRGSVAVTGPMCDSSRPVLAGHQLVADVPRGRVLESTISLEGEAYSAVDGTVAVREEQPLDNTNSRGGMASSAAEPSGLDFATTASSVASVVSRNGNVPERSVAEWLRLARAGKLKQAFVSAESQGFSGICGTANAAELLLLGDAARLAGRSDRASDALLSLRRRFPNDSRRAVAAFALGKVAFDQRRAYADAAHWFATFLQEQPGGSLSREASGRLVEALRAAGDNAGARRAAQSYLQKYPDGPHARVAQSVLE